MSCSCGCGKEARVGEYHSDCRVPCKCGCGGRARYAYAPGHRPAKRECLRCGVKFAPLASEGGLCSQCRRHVKSGAPLERNGELINSRKMQAASPEGRRWCSGCNQYRLLKFFGRNREGYYSRCRPCAKAQGRASRVQRVYSITPERYEEIKRLQGGKCAICQIATGRTKALAVDHDHSCCPGKTSCGRCVRGVLCSRCNQMLGHGRDNAEFFRRAAAYLENPPARTEGNTE